MSIKHRIRKHNFSMRLGEMEDALLDLRKDEADMTKAEYIRNIILFAPAGERPKFSNVFAEGLYKKLNDTGQILNVVADAVNYIMNKIYPQLFRNADKLKLT